MLQSLELFTGAGGLALGLSMAGFKPLAVVERDRWACDSIRENQARSFPLVVDWPLYDCDVRDFDLTSVPEGIDLIAGGPPCQPFSQGGKHRGFSDTRDMFPVMVEFVRRVRPKAFIIENVKGLTRPGFANYLSYILLQLTHPELGPKRDEEWTDHLARLQKLDTSSPRTDLTYNVVHEVLNAADFGVPQRRERVFIVGFRSDIDARWSFPKETHSLDALLAQQFITGEYWERHQIKRSLRKQALGRFSRRVDRLRQTNLLLDHAPWRTVRDAIGGMPDPEKDSGIYRDHRFQAGAKSYPGHTGSEMDLPAKTLKAGDHGVPGGENMMVKDNGKVRYFTVRESARLQTFPDGYAFHGSWSETMRQLGNAVPVSLGQRVGASVARKLIENEERDLKRRLLANAER
jgi:DNA (cytosine-5)-methyltransferase 1